MLLLVDDFAPESQYEKTLAASRKPIASNLAVREEDGGHCSDNSFERRDFSQGDSTQAENCRNRFRPFFAHTTGSGKFASTVARAVSGGGVAAVIPARLGLAIFTKFLESPGS